MSPLGLRPVHLVVRLHLPSYIGHQLSVILLLQEGASGLVISERGRILIYGVELRALTIRSVCLHLSLEIGFNELTAAI